MIPLATGVRVWIATGHTDMRRGMNSLALLVQESLRRDPHGGDLYVFRGKSGKLIKFSGTMVSACRSTPSGWSAESSSGLRRRPARCQSLQRRWPTCLKGSTGGTHSRPAAAERRLSG